MEKLQNGFATHCFAMMDTDYALCGCAHGCEFHKLCCAQPQTANSGNTAAFSNVAPLQLYFLIINVHDKRFDIDETNGGKVAIGSMAIFTIGDVCDSSHPKMRVIFHNYK